MDIDNFIIAIQIMVGILPITLLIEERHRLYYTDSGEMASKRPEGELMQTHGKKDGPHMLEQYWQGVYLDGSRVWYYMIWKLLKYYARSLSLASNVMRSFFVFEALQCRYG